MEEESIILCDTNILIEFYKENPKVIRNLRDIGQDNMAISIVTAGELLYGAFNKKELNRINQDIAHLRLLHLNHQTGERFIQLMTQVKVKAKVKP